MNDKTIFSSAEILLPKFVRDEASMQKWAVIACDQFTSELSYWNKCQSLVGEAPSTLKYIMPEAYLNTEYETFHNKIISESMRNFSDENMTMVNGLISLVRTLPDGKIRRGLIGKIDLEAYCYESGSHSPIRATEKTVLERIPPRCKVRAEAKIELPHILILVNSTEMFDYAEAFHKAENVVYDFDLMLGGGHVTAYKITDNSLDAISKRIYDYEIQNPGLTYAMGDGNHSLAAAKAHWENLKKMGAPEDHPARYALCELTPLDDDSLVFEPIYRILKNVNQSDVLSKLRSITNKNGEQKITVICSGTSEDLAFSVPTHALTVGSLQNFIDGYLAENPNTSCDYIHGEEAVYKLCQSSDTIGFLLDGMNKNDLFPYVDENGTLPRKTFSMGEAESKRYYIETRKIIL